MIARIWHGTTPSEKADAYLTFLVARALPDYRATPGNLAAHVLRRADGKITHFVTLTFWESLAAIEAFAGPEVTRARYYPEDADFLVELEPAVQHFEEYS